MALAFSSGVYFEGMGLLVCNPVPSIKPGAIHDGTPRTVRGSVVQDQAAPTYQEVVGDPEERVEARRRAHQ